MEQRILAIIICLAVICSGCAMEPETSSTVTPTPSVAESDSAKSDAELPITHGPLGQRHKAVQSVSEVFRTVESLRDARRFTVAELQPIAKTTRYQAVLLSQCDLEVLKVLVASDWAPVVVIRSPVGPKHVRAVVGYDDMMKRIILADPMNYTEARIEYSDFSKQWDDPRKSCLMVLSSLDSADRIRSKLMKYLSKEKVDKVIIKKSGRQ